jgi:hypothetical protein
MRGTWPNKITAHNAGWRFQFRFAGSVFGPACVSSSVSAYAPISRDNPSRVSDLSRGACFRLQIEPSKSRGDMHALRRTKGRAFSGGH